MQSLAGDTCGLGGVVSENFKKKKGRMFFGDQGYGGVLGTVGGRVGACSSREWEIPGACGRSKD